MNPLERFRSNLASVLPEGLAPDRPLAVAVSGGPDSMALLWLAARAFPGQVIAATVDHGLRPENADEAAAVACWCETAHLPHAALTVPVPPRTTGNLQAWARQERYLLLKRWAIEQGAAALATAHHADDQAETFLMRAARGSGLSGLAAVRARLDEEVPLTASHWQQGPDGSGTTVTCGRVPTIRPLLGWRRGELRTLCEAEALPFVDDPSNADDRFDRTRFRGLLAAAPWLDAVAIGRSAAYLAEVDRDLLAVSRWLYAQRMVQDDPSRAVLDVADLPRGVRRLIARIAIDGVRVTKGIQSPAWSWAIAIEPLLDALEAGRSATQAGVLVTPNGTIWRFTEAPPRSG